MAVSPTIPRVQAMVVCDDIQFHAEEPGVFDLVGVRTEILAPSFPHVQHLLCIYAQITGHPGTVSFRVEITQAGSERNVQSGPELEAQLDGPLVMVPLMWGMEHCTFPEPGLYYIQLYCGVRLVNERFLTLSLDEG